MKWFKKILIASAIALSSVFAIGQDSPDFQTGNSSVNVGDLETRIAALEKLVFGFDKTDAQEVFYANMADSLDRTTYRRDWTPSSDVQFITEADPNQLIDLVLFNDVSKYGTTVVKTPGKNFGVAFNLIVPSETTGSKVIAGSMSGTTGWQARWSGDNKSLSFHTGAGAATDSIYSGNDVFFVDTIAPHNAIWVVWVVRGTTATLYVNGVAISTAGNVVSGFNQAASLTIGADKALAISADAYVDEFKMFKGTPTAFEVGKRWVLNKYFNNSIVVPTLSGASIPLNSNGNFLIGSFSQVVSGIVEVNDSTAKAFDMQINGSSTLIDSIEHNGASITFYFNSDTVEYGNSVILSYDQTYYSGLKNSQGLYLNTFNNVSVVNNVEQGGVVGYVSAAIVDYGFNNDNEDSSPAGNYPRNDSVVTFNSLFYTEGSQSLWGTGSRYSYLPDAFTLPVTDTLLFIADVFSVNNANNQAVFENSTASTPILIELDVTSDRVMVEVGATTAQGNSTLLEDTWYQIAVLYVPASGNCRFWVDGVEKINDQVSGTGGSLSGKFRLVEGNVLIDNMHIYNQIPGPGSLSDSILYLYNNSGARLMKVDTGYIAPDIPTPSSDFDLIADVILDQSFDNVTIGTAYIQELRDDFNNGNDFFYEGSGAWKATTFPGGTSDDYPRHMGYYNQNGVLDTALAFTQIQYSSPPSDIYSYMPCQFLIPIPTTASTGADTYFGYTSVWPGALWDKITNDREWKLMQLQAGVKIHPPEDDGKAYALTHNLDGRPYSTARLKMMGKDQGAPAIGTTNRTHFVEYCISGAYDIENYSGGTSAPFPQGEPVTEVYNNNARKVLTHVASDSVIVHITMRGNLGTPNVADGFFEFFFDGKFAFRLDTDYNGLAFILRDDYSVLWDAMQLSYFWGGGKTEDYPHDDDARILFDDFLIWSYKDSYYPKGQKSPDNRILEIKGFHYDYGTNEWVKE